MATGRNGKSGFDFRMSKKVAELTQVVHMLFTRNHEKEVEAEAMKDAYEYEIELVMRDANSKLETLHTQIKVLQTAADARSAVTQDAVSVAEREWSRKLDTLSEQLQAEKLECQKSRDLLIRAQQDIERLREGRSDEQHRAEQRAADSVQEAARLREQLVDLQRVLKGRQAELERLAEQQRAAGSLAQQLEAAKKAIDELSRVKEQVVSRNKQLEADIKQLRKELSKRIASSAKVKGTPPPPAPPAPASAPLATATYDGELEQLRQQVQMYRMELLNREMNFNRMFTEKQPVNVSSQQKGPKLQYTQGPDSMNGLRYSREYTTLTPTRQKTFYTTRRTSDGELPPAESPRSGSSADHVYHNSAGDQRTRIRQMLTKPKPLPRQMLSAKAKT